ncbi:hypothetical protein LZ30DRAFT_429351 [Colletotrichum cereale]|nr:hypothetical protein LZ30DRAFT_429351 [Colletotrichum cereale]
MAAAQKSPVSSKPWEPSTARNKRPQYPRSPPRREGCMPRGGKLIIRLISSRRTVSHPLMQFAIRKPGVSEGSHPPPPPSPQIRETCPAPAARSIRWRLQTVVVSDSARRVSNCDLPCLLLCHFISFMVMSMMILRKPMDRILLQTRDNVWLVDFVRNADVAVSTKPLAWARIRITLYVIPQKTPMPGSYKEPRRHVSRLTFPSMGLGGIPRTERSCNNSTSASTEDGGCEKSEIAGPGLEYARCRCPFRASLPCLQSLETERSFLSLSVSRWPNLVRLLESGSARISNSLVEAQGSGPLMRL